MSEKKQPKIKNSVNLGKLTYLFKPNTYMNLSKCNLVFGRNASGKSSISRYLKKHGSNVLSTHINNKNIHLYNRKYILDHLISNSEIDRSTGEQLESISLGKTNVDIHNELNNLRSENSLLENDAQNIRDELNNVKQKYSDKKSKKDQWLVNSARFLKNKHREVVSSSYNKKKFAKDLETPFQDISDNKLNQLKNELLKSTKAIPHRPNIFPDIKITELNVEIIFLLKSVVGPNFLTSIKGIDNNSKALFAQQGMILHKHSKFCAFCGNYITKERRKDLHNFFNHKYYQIRDKIKKLRHVIRNYNNKLSNVYQINVYKFNLRYRSNAKNINFKIRKTYKFYKNLLNKFYSYLKKKIRNINQVIKMPSPHHSDLSFQLLETEINSLIDKNNSYQKYLKRNINKDKICKIIRLHFVLKKKNQFMYKNPNYNQELNKLCRRVNILNEELYVKKEDIYKISYKEKDLLSHFQKKDIAEKSINKHLKSLRDNSFILKYSNKNNGEYYIHSKNSRDGSKRGFNTLSLGERNLISFLYFYNEISPNNPNIDESKDQLIIFDDPMDGNDAEFQYLMVSLLQRLINDMTVRKENGKLVHNAFYKYQLIIFTHDVNFYLNIKHGIRNDRLKKIHLIKIEDGTEIQDINEKNHDFYNNYEELWAETIFLYNKRQYNIMLNPIRRIIETFLNFNFIPKDVFFKGHENVKKLLDINSHGIDDVGAIPNVHNGNYIMNTVRKLFYNVEGKRHFNRYWDYFKNYGK